MRIGLTFDLRDHYRALGFSEEDVAEFDFGETIDAIDATLKELGFETERIGTITELVPMLAEGRRHWDLVFNIAEGVYGIGREAQVPALCDAYKIPYTFSDPCIMALALNKDLTKRVIRDLGLPTPDFQLISSIDEIKSIHLKFPLFAKPYAEGTGKGINASSVIKDKKTLTEVCTGLLKRYNQPVLVESYLPGREFTVGIIGSGEEARIAGVMEVILHSGAEDGVYSYSNKENCEEVVTYTLVDDNTAKIAGKLALDSWRGLGCLDAGRVDIRCDAAGNPNFIEVNPLAGLHPEHSDLPIICTKAGISFIELIGSIVSSALKRCGLIDSAPQKVKEISKSSHRTNNFSSLVNPAKKKTNLKTIVILHQHVPESASPDEKDVLVQRDEIADSIERLGYEPVKVAMTLDVEAAKNALYAAKPLKVVNLVESIDGSDRLMGIAPALLDSLSMDYTGSGADAIAMTGNKVLAKRLMKQAGIPTPPFFLISEIENAKLPKGAYIIKSSFDHASIGIDENSLIKVYGKIDKAAFIKASGKYKSESFAERFIDGREFNIAILDGPDGPEILPHAEIVFKNYPKGKPRIVNYKAKWETDSFEYKNTVRNYKFAKSDKRMLGLLSKYALKCWDVFGLRGYARVDFRVDADGKPWVLEINANPCLSSDAGFIAAAEQKGLAFDDVIRRILSLT
jgi:D-alanine-D-alanine ligase